MYCILPPWGYYSTQVLKNDSTNIYIKDSILLTHTMVHQASYHFLINYKGSCRIYRFFTKLIRDIPFLY